MKCSPLPVNDALKGPAGDDPPSALQRIKRNKIFGKISSFAGELFFPEICVVCGQSTGSVICSKCAKDVIKYSRPSEHAGDLYPYGKLFCYGKYTGVLKETFTRYKFKGEVWMGRRFGRLIFESFGSMFRDYSCVTYVPVSRERLKKRGFDQCREMTSEISRLSGLKTVRLIEADPGKQKQSGLGFSQRSSNASGKFSVNWYGNRNLVAGSKILLIDDILTTGSTLRECAELIVDELGALSVDAAVFASGRSDLGNS